jgi:hypothetical protein
MGWENDGRYYTRSRRLNGRVVREYVGRGAQAQLAAENDQIRRREAAAARQAWRTEQERVQELEAPMKELDALCDLLMRTTLEDAGYYQHDRGEWRRRHG